MKVRSLSIAFLLLVFSSLNTPAARAHAALERTIPEKGSTVSRSTNQVSMVFGEEILVLKAKTPNSITVLDSNGAIVSTGKVVISGMKISSALKSPLKVGRYKVNYRVVSTDGHVVTGRYSFTVK